MPSLVRSFKKAPDLAALWILLCAFCSCAGWILSLLHELNGLGYIVAFALALGGFALWACTTEVGLRLPPASKLVRRFKRPLPLSFLILSTLAFVGGALHPPTNWDALTYRVPRVLHWLAEGRWHWIHTVFPRVNLRGCGFEWMMAPLIALTKTDRPFFLINFISFALMPGLFFMSLRGVGVRGRVAAQWMWILPAGYCFLLQAASLGNDLFAAFFALGAFAYGLRGRQQGRSGDLWLSMLAIALTTGVKANNLPLVLVWAVVVAPCWRLLSARPIATVSTALVCLLISFFPTAVLNSWYAGDWTGTKAEGFPPLRSPHPLARIEANSGVLFMQNFAPPVAPFAKWWNAQVAPSLASQAMTSEMGAFGQDMRESPVFRLDELAIEETTGMGLGACGLLLVSTIAALRFAWAQRSPTSGPSLGRRDAAQTRGRGRPRYAVSPSQAWVLAAIALTTLVFLAASFATEFEARLMSAYYPFLVVPFLLPLAHAQIVRQRWWRIAALAVAAMAIIPLALSPPRPLLPMLTIVKKLRQHGWSSPLAVRTERVYSAYSIRGEGLEPLTRLLPSDDKRLGFIGVDDPETSLWKPFGSRRVIDVCPGDTAAQLRAEGIRFIALHSPRFAEEFRIPVEQWCSEIGARTFQTLSLDLRAGEGPSEWRVVELQ